MALTEIDSASVNEWLLVVDECGSMFESPMSEDSCISKLDDDWIPYQEQLNKSKLYV
jgi:hypothetical protein